MKVSSTKKRLLFGIVLVIGSAAMLAAQTVAPVTTAPTATTSITFTAGSEAVAVRYGGGWGVGTHETESYDLIDWGATKANHLALIGHEVTAGTAGFNSYLGGMRYMPNLGKLLSKTNLPANAIAVYLDGAAGTSTFAAVTGNKFTFLAGVGLQVSVSSSVSATAFNVGWLRVGSTNVPVISAGLKYFFN